MHLVPQPLIVTEKRGRLNLADVERIAYADLFGDEHTFRTACLLRDVFRDRYGRELPVEAAEKGGRKGAVLLGLWRDAAMRKALAAVPRAEDTEVFTGEGYVLAVRPGGVVVAGADARGLFYGVQTFLQLIERDRDGGGKSFSAPCVDIVDRPGHPFRGVHLYVPPRSEIPHFKRLIGYLASLKINTIVLELAGGMEFKRHPEINRAWTEFHRTERENAFGSTGIRSWHSLHGCYGNSTHTDLAGGSWITQDDMRELVACAREHHVRLCPEIQSLSHSYWLCLAHPELAERQDTAFPSEYCPSNPKTYEILFDCMDEVLEVMRPEWVSIGHDEWYHYCLCPKCRGRRAGELLAEDVNRLYARLKSRGVKCLMWGDKLMNPAELDTKSYKDPVVGTVPYAGAERTFTDDAGGKYVRHFCADAVDGIDDEVMVADWYYYITTGSEKYFARHGKTMVWGNFGPPYFDEHPRRLSDPNVRGGIFSSWYEASRKVLGICAWPPEAVIAADMLWADSWTRGRLAERRNTHDAVWLRQRDQLNDGLHRLVSREAGPTKKLRFVTLDLSKAAGQGGDEAPPPLDVGKIDHPVDFRPAPRPLVIRAGSQDRVTLAIGRQVRGVALLLRYLEGSISAKTKEIFFFQHYEDYFLSREVGRCRLLAEDIPANPYHYPPEGELRLRLGGELGLDGRPSGFADRLTTSAGETLYVYEWRNHNPDNLRIRELVLEPGRAPLDGRLIVHAVTLLV